MQPNFGAEAVFALRAVSAFGGRLFAPPPKGRGKVVAAAFINRPEPCGSESIRAQPEKWYDERMMPFWGPSGGGATRGSPQAPARAWPHFLRPPQRPKRHSVTPSSALRAKG